MTADSSPQIATMANAVTHTILLKRTLRLFIACSFPLACGFILPAFTFVGGGLGFGGPEVLAGSSVR